MALERQSIEKKDFPIGRRGYDPEAVDAHLRAIADEVQELGSSSRRRSETVASTASGQVRAIVEAAESSAAEILRQAEDEAREIRADASTQMRSAHEQANAEAREQVDRVSQATAAMRERLDALATELNTLLESLRTGTVRLDADLRELAGKLAEVTEATQPQPRVEAIGRPLPKPEPEPGGRPLPGPEAVAGPLPGPEPEPAPAPVGSPSDGAEDVEGARLIALNMALNNTPRAEVDRYLAEHFELRDRSRLLDEVYASLGG